MGFGSDSPRCSEPRGNEQTISQPLHILVRFVGEIGGPVAIHAHPELSSLSCARRGVHPLHWALLHESDGDLVTCRAVRLTLVELHTHLQTLLRVRPHNLRVAIGRVRPQNGDKAIRDQEVLEAGVSRTGHELHNKVEILHMELGELRQPAGESWPERSVDAPDVQVPSEIPFVEFVYPGRDPIRRVVGVRLGAAVERLCL
mmetsp:Transcript_34731/g.79233  ORF Transcript_34731/g.79233 Transcript_34731/m.79233 type:complete len:201 (-) Transcript_34731:787-1389(-)